MGLINKLGDTVNGIAGNLSEISPEALNEEFGMYLMEGESIAMGFKLIRDVVILTDKRIIDIDKQGATGAKMRINSINLSTIIHVSVETAGFGIDDSEITIRYITTPYFKCSGGVQWGEKMFVLPKSYDIQPLYQYLQEVAYHNHEALNS